MWKRVSVVVLRVGAERALEPLKLRVGAERALEPLKVRREQVGQRCPCDGASECGGVPHQKCVLARLCATNKFGGVPHQAVVWLVWVEASFGGVPHQTAVWLVQVQASSAVCLIRRACGLVG